ncbi:MAG: ribosome maturation factor RimM, partial [Thermoplasmata archaeon]
MSRPDEVVVGVVGRPWGRKGQFLVNTWGSDAQFVLSRKRLRLRRKGAGGMDYPIRSSHFAGGRLVVEVDGCASPGDAESLRGAEVVVQAGEFAPAPAGTFYPHELAGLEVVRAGGQVVGRVE